MKGSNTTLQIELLPKQHFCWDSEKLTLLAYGEMVIQYIYLAQQHSVSNAQYTYHKETRFTCRQVFTAFFFKSRLNN